MKTTPWFPPEIKPVHVGVYEVDVQVDAYLVVRWCHWNGQGWGYYCRNYEDAADPANLFDNTHSNFYAKQNKRWRGLTEKAA